jgi:hypothetical protein
LEGAEGRWPLREAKGRKIDHGGGGVGKKREGASPEAVYL